MPVVPSPAPAARVFKLCPVLWVIREGTERGKGRYYRLGAGQGWGSKATATKWTAHKPETLAGTVGGRVVKLRPATRRVA